MALQGRHLHDLAPARWPISGIAAQCKALQPRGVVGLKIDSSMTKYDDDDSTAEGLD
jgi:hypothetical protein